MVGPLLLECLLCEDVSGAKQDEGGRALSEHRPPDEGCTKKTNTGCQHGLAWLARGKKLGGSNYNSLERVHESGHVGPK